MSLFYRKNVIIRPRVVWFIENGYLWFVGMDGKDCRGKSQCRLKDLTKLMSSLSPNQQNFLEDIEFHKFIGVSYSSDLPKDLTWDLVSRVDVDKGTLVINGTPFNIEESVKRLLPLPHGSDEYEIKNIPNNS